VSSRTETRLFGVDSYFKKYLSYGSIYCNELLREALVNYLNETRGLNITIDNILITRGSQMGI